MDVALDTRLRHLRLSGMAEALPGRLQQAAGASLPHQDFLSQWKRTPRHFVNSARDGVALASDWQRCGYYAWAELAQPTVAGRIAAVHGDLDGTEDYVDLLVGEFKHQLASDGHQRTSLGLGRGDGRGCGQNHGRDRDDGDRLLEPLEETTQALHDLLLGLRGGQ